MSNTTTPIKTTKFQIKSTHTSLSEAVDAAGLDKSYNEYEANRKIKLFEDHKWIKEAYVISANTEDNAGPARVFMLTNNGEHLSELDLFESWMDDRGLDIVKITGDVIQILKANIPNTDEGRETLSKAGWITTKIEA